MRAVSCAVCSCRVAWSAVVASSRTATLRAIDPSGRDVGLGHLLVDRVVDGELLPLVLGVGFAVDDSDGVFLVDARFAQWRGGGVGALEFAAGAGRGVEVELGADLDNTAPGTGDLVQDALRGGALPVARSGGAGGGRGAEQAPRPGR